MSFAGEPILLASASPRRRELLAAAGWSVQTHPTEIDETQTPGEDAEEYVVRLARAKAAAVAPLYPATSTVLGADTAVVIAGAVLGKPRDEADATRMIQHLAGGSHQVLTGVCLRRGERERVGLAVTQVWFSPLTGEEIAAYVASGEGHDKAGAYAIQGLAARFIPRIEGSYSNVVGLPLALAWELWKQL